ncbi:alpha/beta fold hydrolase [uncultured Sphingomonas sp.]|uniref:alpha/beta fold hydrolase n=1 Tax=uncultured Sphingomonas sp. TaxID=158754 RepID=UPI0035C96843
MTLAPLILVPGLGSDEAVWRGVIERLAAVAACQIAETRLDDSIAAIAARVLASALPAFALAGISMGGYVALEIVRQAPGRVVRLSLFDTNARPDTPEQSAGRRAAVAALDKAPMATLSRLSLPQLVADDASDEVRDAVVAMGVRVGKDAYARQQAANIARSDSRPHLAAIAVPTLIAVGERDVLTPPVLAEELRDGISGARLHVISGSGHLPPIEQPDAVAALLRDWLAG